MRVSHLASEVARLSPLVYHVTNWVSGPLSARVCYALGGRALMTTHPEEALEAARMSQALLLNLGTPTEDRVVSIRRALDGAGDRPALLDPVGVGSFPGRLDLAMEILSRGISILKGNGAEISALLGEGKGQRGVDSDLPGPPLGVRRLAEDHRCCAVMTGEEDHVALGVSWGLVRLRGREVRGAVPVPGLGCALGSAMACALGVGADPFSAALWGCALFKGALRRALGACCGPGSLVEALIDQLHRARTGELDGENVEVIRADG
ncbi:Hydroxyethylthiazole kinase [Thermanaerovibrio acidaminovorans DSM 6589]|uniref:hydroxyethylthiazole kinase n=1 Tax=Thermanaerovibrio acidaminovorans (strain ATCC 49978 / DSM 6589 / Su883) TaxID=525903 RepID=D1B7D3_THEAS|nr:hydroxyethylthiazole kinase [Thermanaerovibrio acidaminovorans]ACZ19924.1 Hydroxyethylthiazole kinase [Thermanaerovibrio acidaminovorans DSM 6589]